MTKRLIATALLCPIAVCAQSSATIYGIADLGVRHSSGLSAGHAPDPGNTNAVTSGVNNTSRLGYRGSEDLGGGLRALFNLETGLNVDAGTTVNTAKFFDRASVLGLGGGWGTLLAGRQTNLLADAISPVDAVGMRFASFNPNIVTTAVSTHGLGVEYGTSGATTGSYRLDNSLKYAGRFGGFTAKAMYSFGETSNAASAKSSTGLGGQYQIEQFVVSGAWQKFKSANYLDLDAGTLGAAYQFKSVKLAANYGRNKGQTTGTASTVQKVASAGATWAATPAVDLTAAYYKLDRSRTGAADDGYSRVILFAEYKLSRRSKLYAQADYTDWKNGYQGSGNKASGTGATLGVMHTF
ncbi:porin [Xylophilus rhododendri]|uniref:Porin n=1 Tax=Xylophilus rhododendri TaxID=2697032 RepID=A0A857J648_9BURK|nr:porin [Xylophilus rhododendri]QHI98471.1 porin [Xylophilus rhododendri]